MTPYPFRLTVLCLLALLPGLLAAADLGQLLLENRSAATVKVVAPGGGWILPPGAEAQPVELPIEDPRGVQLNIWWKHNPRELCLLQTVWSRHVLITGKQHIACMSKPH